MARVPFDKLCVVITAGAFVAAVYSPPVFADLWKDMARRAVHGAVRGAVDEVNSRVGGSRSYGRSDVDEAPSEYHANTTSGSSYETRVPSAPQPAHSSSAEQARSYYDTSSGGAPSYGSSSGFKVGGYQNLQLNKPKVSPFDQRAQEAPSWQTTPTPRYEHHAAPVEKSVEMGYRYSTARRPVPVTRTTKPSSAVLESEHLVLPGFPGGGLIVKED